MRVNLYDVAEDGTETLTDENISLTDCYPGVENEDDYWLAHECLTRAGSHMTGGGAAPLRAIRRYVPEGVVGFAWRS